MAYTCTMLLLLTGLWAQTAFDAFEKEMGSLTGNVTCTCGCPHILNQCGDECGRAPEMKEELSGMLAAGLTEPQVYDRLEEQFGSAIFAVPRAEGFNLLAWVIPFLALGLGFVGVAFVIKSLKPQPTDASAALDASHPISPKYRKILDEELRR